MPAGNGRPAGAPRGARADGHRGRTRGVRVLLAACLFAIGAEASAAGGAAGAGEGPGEGAAPPGAGAASDLVWCHDEARAIVRQRARWRCEHRIVDEAEAKRVREARTRRIQRVLQREREPLLPGKRLSGTGTGFFVSDDGHLITNAHVIGGCDALTVTPANGEERTARLLSADASRDLALLGTSHASPDPARFRDTDAVVRGEPATLVGYPLHGKVVIRPVMVTGEVDADEQPTDPRVFAVSIDVRRGNSGGPILDRSGRVIGVIFAKADTPKIFKKTGRIVRDVGIGLSLAVVREFLRATPVAMTVSRDDSRLDANDLMQRAQSFVAQVRCWR